jgi:hypothetical protein
LPSWLNVIFVEMAASNFIWLPSAAHSLSSSVAHSPSIQSSYTPSSVLVTIPIFATLLLDSHHTHTIHLRLKAFLAELSYGRPSSPSCVSTPPARACLHRPLSSRTHYNVSFHRSSQKRPYHSKPAPRASPCRPSIQRRMAQEAYTVHGASTGADLRKRSLPPTSAASHPHTVSE